MQSSRTTTVADGRIVDNRWRHDLTVICCIESGMHDCDIDKWWHGRTGTQSWYRVQLRRHSSEHYVNVLQYRRRLIDCRHSINRLCIGRVVQLYSPPIVTSRTVVAQAEAVQVNSSLKHWTHSNIHTNMPVNTLHVFDIKLKYPRNTLYQLKCWPTVAWIMQRNCVSARGALWGTTATF